MKVSIDAVTTGGQTPLHIAAKWGRLGVVNALVEGGANVSVTATTPAPIFFVLPKDIEGLWLLRSRMERELVLSTLFC